MAKNRNPKKNDFFNKILNDYLNETKKENLNPNYFHDSNYYYDVLDHFTTTSTIMNKTMDKFLGDPYELLNKNATADEIGQWINEVEAIRNNGKSLMETLKDPSKDFTKHQYGVNVDKDFFDMIKDSFDELGEERISLYRQQEQALRNRQKYKNKDIMNEIEAQKLIEESNRIKDSIPKRGDQYYDSKRKRQYVYEGPDETFEGMHSFISDQGRTFVGSLDDLEKFTDESRFLNIDDLSEYRSAIDDLHTFLGDIRHGSKSMEDGFWDRAQKAVRRVNKAEGKVKKKIKYHRMENDTYKTKKVLQGYIDDWEKKHTQQSTPQPENVPKTNTSETDVPLEEEWFDGYDGADNVPFGAEDFDDEFLANLTDDQILNQARNNEELERYIKMRDDARTRLGMDNQTFNIETENKTINNNFNGVNQEYQQRQTQKQTKNTAEETIEEKIKRLTEEERQRFERESQADFDKSMEEIEAEFNQEAERIENEFGPAKYDLDDTSLHLDSPDIKIRKQRLENAGKRLSNNKGPNGTKKRFTGQRVANNSKRSIKKKKLSGKKFKVKGGNLKQAAANTFVNIATDAVKETISKNADELKNFGRHPNMFDFDEFADLTDADIDFYYDNLFGMDIKTKQQMKKSWIEKRKLAKTARKSANKRKIIDNFDDYMDNVFSYTGYSSVEGQARFSPDPEVGWDEADFKNPDSYNRHRIDFEVDDDGNLKFKRYDEMDTIEIEQNKSRRIKSNIDDDDIFGWMKKHKLGLG